MAVVGRIPGVMASVIHSFITVECQLSFYLMMRQAQQWRSWTTGMSQFERPSSSKALWSGSCVSSGRPIGTTSRSSGDSDSPKSSTTTRSAEGWASRRNGKAGTPSVGSWWSEPRPRIPESTPAPWTDDPRPTCRFTSSKVIRLSKNQIESSNQMFF